MTVYLLHGDHKKGGVVHYIGYTSRTAEIRLYEHQNGMAKYTSAMQKKGFKWKLARTWDGASLSFEAHLKKLKIHKYLCPCCGNAVQNVENKTAEEVLELWRIKNAK